MLGRVPGRLQDIRDDIGDREVCDRIAAGFVEQHDVVALRNPYAIEEHSHPPPQRFGKQQSRRKRFGDEKAADRATCQWSLLPRQTHRHRPFVRVAGADRRCSSGQ
jgi:hypothetical protein